MLERDAVTKKHDGCPNRNHCRKNEMHCCYLRKGDNTCYLNSDESEDFV